MKWWNNFTPEERSMLREYVGVFWYEASVTITVKALLEEIKKNKEKEML